MGIMWEPGDGKSLLFWEDNRLGDLGHLKHLALRDISESELSKKVCDYVTQDGQWSWSSFEKLLLVSTLIQIASIKPPSPDDGAPQCYWGPSSYGAFTIRSAHEFVYH